MKPPLSYMPMLPAAVGIGVGILMQSLMAFWLCAILCIVSFCALYYLKRQYLAFFPLMTFVGYALALLHSPPQIESFAPSKALFEAKVVMSFETTNGQKILVEAFKADHADINPMLCLLETPSLDNGIQAGSCIEFISTPVQLPAPSIVPDAIDYYNYWRRLGVTAIFKINPAEVKITSEPNKWRRLVAKMRNAIYNGIVDSPISGKCAAFLLGAILGDKQYVDQSDITHYQITGVAHILALSGLHVAIIAALLSFVLIPFKLHRKGYIIRALLVILLIWSYAIVVGLSDSVVRASIMITVFLISQILQRGYHAANSLCVAFVSILIFSPDSIYAVGFQMSFAAVASILIFVNLLPKHLREHQTAYFLVNLIAMPIAAMFGTGLISAYYFHIMPVMFLLANIIVGLIFPLLLTIGILLTILTLSGASIGILGKFVDFLYNLMQSGIDSVADIAAIEGIYFSPALIWPCMLALALFAYALKSKKRVWTIWGSVSLVLAIIIGVIDRPNYPKIELFIPSELGGDVIMRQDKVAFLISASDPAASKKRADRLYRNYLSQRCQTSNFVLVNGPMTSAKLCYRDNIIRFDTLAIAIVDDGFDQRLFQTRHCNYAIVTRSFAKGIKDIMSSVNPDTILLSSDLHSARAKRLLREAGDTIPIYKIKQHPVVIQKWE